MSATYTSIPQGKKLWLQFLFNFEIVSKLKKIFNEVNSYQCCKWDISVFFFFFFPDFAFSSCFPKLEACRLLVTLQICEAPGKQLSSIWCSLQMAMFSSGLTQVADPVSKSLPQETSYKWPSAQVQCFFLGFPFLSSKIWGYQI